MKKGGGNILLHLLFHRFGSKLPDWVEDRLNNATTTELEQWSVASMHAKTLDEVFGGNDTEH